MPSFAPQLRESFMPITLVIIAITCIVSFMAFKNSRLMNDLILWPPAITRQREYHRLVTYGWCTRISGTCCSTCSRCSSSAG